MLQLELFWVNGEAALTANTLQKKLNKDWIPRFSGSQLGDIAASTGAGSGGGRTKNLLEMDQIMGNILTHKKSADSKLVRGGYAAALEEVCKRCSQCQGGEQWSSEAAGGGAH